MHQISWENKGSVSAIAQPKQEDLFSPVAIGSHPPGNGGTTGVTVEKKNSPFDGGGKEGKEGE